jgi:glycosyltransferase involved in cell wall biosynthesis
MSRISAHMVVKNEERWVWYAIMAVIDHVHELIIFDTGSTDKTVEIIKTIKNDKIIFKQLDFTKVDGPVHTIARQEMMKLKKWDWIVLVDGDEIWTDNGIRELATAIKNDGDNLEFFIKPYLNMLGDVYHYQDESAGKYKVGGYKGHITVRGMNASLIPGLHIENPLPFEGFFDENHTLIQDRLPRKANTLKEPFLHMTHLLRSTTRNKDKQVYRRQNKFKYELGIPLPENFNYPKCFYLPRPDLVPEPWGKRSLAYTVNALWQTPLKKFKRLVTNG